VAAGREHAATAQDLDARRSCTDRNYRLIELSQFCPLAHTCAVSHVCDLSRSGVCDLEVSRPQSLLQRLKDCYVVNEHLVPSATPVDKLNDEVSVDRPGDAR